MNGLSRRTAALAALVMTASGCDVPGESPPPASSLAPFEEVSSAWGLEFRHRAGRTDDWNIMEIMGSGLALLDWDNDGDLDVFALSRRSPSVLFENQGDGRFITRLSLDLDGAMGCAVGDYDGDGFRDIFVTCDGKNRLLHNNGGSDLEDRTEAAGVGHPGTGTSSVFADLDADADLDLYVANYVDPSSSRGSCPSLSLGPEVPDYCHPGVYDPQPDLHYRNNGDGTFTDATVEAGLDVAPGYGLGVAAFDADGDGDLDLYVANDSTGNFLFINAGDGTFRETGLTSGTAYNEYGKAESGMGIGLLQQKSGGVPAILATNLLNETNTLYVPDGEHGYREETAIRRLGASSLPFTGFGLSFLDVDNDGLDDLYIANGSVARLGNSTTTTTFADRYGQQDLLYRGDRDGDFSAFPGAVPAIGPRTVARGVAAGDLDGDGRLDLVVTACDGPLRVLRNVSAAPGNWLAVELLDARNVPVGAGARVRLEFPGGAAEKITTAGEGYLTAPPDRLHFGLGAISTVQRLIVTWPSGATQVMPDVTVNRRLVIRQEAAGGPTAALLPDRNKPGH
ncbi:MAG: CRTAC1 family protein [Acidobacteriota bacterium]